MHEQRRSARVIRFTVRPAEEKGVTTPGKIFFSRSAAVCALGLPPSRQSSKSKSGWRTGLEYDTRAESTKVMLRTPQP